MEALASLRINEGWWRTLKQNKQKNGVNESRHLEYFQKNLRMNELYLLAEHFIYLENYLSACASSSQTQLPMSFQPSMTPEKDTYSR